MCRDLQNPGYVMPSASLNQAQQSSVEVVHEVGTIVIIPATLKRRIVRSRLHDARNLRVRCVISFPSTHTSCTLRVFVQLKQRELLRLGLRLLSHLELHPSSYQIIRGRFPRLLEEAFGHVHVLEAVRFPEALWSGGNGWQTPCSCGAGGSAVLTQPLIDRFADYVAMRQVFVVFRPHPR